jgi:S-adenosylmethionine-diacylglycerol 3-amino-3-carboxypropyl transferase
MEKGEMRKDRVLTLPRSALLAIRLALAALWLDEGLYLKVWARNPHELRIVSSAAHIVHFNGPLVMVFIGTVETCIALLLILNVWTKRLAQLQFVLLLGMNFAGILFGGGEIADPLYLMVHNLPTFACLFVLMTCEPSAVTHSPWRFGPFRSRRIREQVIFGQVREDYSFEASLAAGDVLCVASAGDLAFECLIRGARSVCAVDVNVAQLWLIELKALALNLERHADVFACFAVDATPYYPSLRQNLSQSARDHFDRHTCTLRDGLQNCGEADRTVRFIAVLFNTLFRSRATVAQFLGYAEIGEQREFYNRCWNDWRWRLAFIIAFNPLSLRLVLSRLFVAAIPASFATDFRLDFDEVFTAVPNASNPFVWQALTGRYPPTYPPVWLREEHWERLKSKLCDLKTYRADLVDFPEKREGEGFQAIFLTNILDVVPVGYPQRLAAALRERCHSGCHVVSRSFFLTRQLQIQANLSEFVSAGLPEADRSFFCRKVEHLMRN